MSLAGRALAAYPRAVQRTDVFPWTAPSLGADAALDVTRRVCVRPPYLALRDLTIAGERLRAVAVAEAPAHTEVGPMPAAEVGRHAAIAGLLNAAALQSDDRRRYYLAREALCVYQPNDAPYGAPVTFDSSLLELDKRGCRTRVRALAGGEPLATIELTYAILTDGAFERLFKRYGRPTPPAPSPYGALLVEAFERGEDWAEQVVPALDPSQCVGHFDGFPALPVAQLMGQLAYLAGRLVGDGETPFRVLRGEIAADDLAWAGERATFRVRRSVDAAASDRFVFDCEALADERSVGRMRLWVASVGGTTLGR